MFPQSFSCMFNGSIANCDCQDIFEKPQFFINGPTAGDVRQGAAGDCWFLAALCTLSDELINRICVARNEQVGVYGFVFYRGMSLPTH